jgi:glycosidase
MPGIPSIYYGSEWGIQGKKTNTSDAPLRPELDLDYMKENAPYKDLPEIIAKYGEIRLNSKSLQKGSYKQVLINNKHFVFQSQYEDECIIVAVNLDEATVYVDINLDCDGAELVDLFNQGSKFDLNNRRAHMDIPAFGVRIMKLEKNKTENSNTEKVVLSI